MLTVAATATTNPINWYIGDTSTYNRITPTFVYNCHFSWLSPSTADLDYNLISVTNTGTLASTSLVA
jgi:hypothetical protein